MSNRKDYEQESQRRLSQSISVGSIVKVVRFDPVKMEVDVQPLSKWLENGKYHSQPMVLGVPVAPVLGGGFAVRPWYVPGDVGAVLYLDHDLDAVLSSGSECEPNTERCHSGEDAVFLGGIRAGDAIMPPGIPNEALVLSNKSGSVYLALKADKIEIRGNVDVIEGTVKITNGDAIADEISLKKHLHEGITEGVGKSGLPVKS